MEARVAAALGAQFGWQVARAATHSPQQLAGIDLIVDDGKAPPRTIDVKFDRTSPNTGNVFIEFKRVIYGQSRPSGIMASSADAWAFVVLPDCYIVRADDIRGSIHVFKRHFRVAPNQDWPSTGFGFLVPVRVIEKMAILKIVV